MKIFKILIIISFTLKASMTISQDVASHLWEHRVLLVLTDHSNPITFQNQIKELQTNEKGLTDIKLIIYQIRKHSFKIGLNHNEWQKSSNLYEKYKDKNAPFEVILIGLDNGVKLRQSNLLTCEAFFSVIDVMPMRKEELKNKKLT